MQERSMQRVRAGHCVLVLGALGACGAGGESLGQTTAAINASTAITWIHQVNTTVSGATITKTGGQPSAEDTGAASQQSIASGDAAFQFTVDETSRFRFVGLGHTSTWQGAANIDYSFRLQAGHADVYQHNTWQANILVAVGDVMKIDVVGGVAHYYKNGTLQFTSSQAPVYPLYVTTSMIDSNSTIAQAMISSGSPPPSGAVTWVNQVNTTVSGATITKTGGQTWAEDAGAASQQAIASGSGTFQFTVDETSRFRFVGLGHTATWQGAANIDFSFRLQAGHADVYESSGYITDILVNAGDVMKIDVASGGARYYKNGALQYASARPPVYPMYVITSMVDGGSTIAQATLTAGSPPPPPPTVSYGQWAYGAPVVADIVHAGFTWFNTGYPGTVSASGNATLSSGGVLPIAYINSSGVPQDDQGLQAQINQYFPGSSWTSINLNNTYPGCTDPNWNVAMVDVRDVRWQNWLIARANAAYSLGNRAIFWDQAGIENLCNLSNTDNGGWGGDTAKQQQAVDAIGSVMNQLRAQHPDLKFMVNHGFKLAHQYTSLVTAFMQENLLNYYSQTNHDQWSTDEIARTQDVRALGITIIDMEYINLMSCSDTTCGYATQLINQAVGLGWVPYVTQQIMNYQGRGATITPPW